MLFLGFDWRERLMLLLKRGRGLMLSLIGFLNRENMRVFW